MAVELKVPAVGESITEVQVATWFKAPGERVERDEPLVELESDKATIELPAPVSGTLAEIRKGAGATASVGETIGTLEEGEGAGGVPSRAASAGAGKDAARATPSPAPVSDGVSAVSPPFVMPAAQRALAEHGLDASQAAPTGPGGRLLKEDVERAAAQRAAGAGEPAGPSDPAPAARGERLVPMSPLRRRVAERLVQAQQTAALLTTFNEIDMAELMALRRRHQEEFTARHGIKLGIMSFFVRATVEALREFPQLNAEIRGQDIVYRDHVDMGIAVGAGKGLAVPVIRGADRLGLAELERVIADFGARAQQNRLDLAELQGGTFTLSNGGVYGSLLSTPIVNPPQSGILGLHAIQDRPVAREGQVVIRPMMYVALTYDHRVVDGREAVTFLKLIKTRIEQPERLLLGI